ncbi:MAG: carbamoyltransferase [Phycisphaerae bacterium]|nr:carbamoyltransferase [Phycisphaerae bacterium]
MTAILGISAFYHDSAAALLVDGDIVAAAQEERFTRIKHDFNFPQHAIDFCLAEAGLKPEQIDYVAFYDKPLLKFERLLETYLAFAPQGFKSFFMAMPLWLKEKLYLPSAMRKGLKGAYKKKFIFTEHHESHAASAFFPSPFDEAAVLTLDGVGEWDTASFGTGRGNRIDLTHVMHFPHSLGLLYSAFTYFTGFKVNSGEYKLMGLAPYGEPTFVDLIRKNLLDIKEDGSFRMDQSYFNYCQGLTMTNDKFARLFGGPARDPESKITQREMDLAASVQKVTEEIMLKTGRHVHKVTGMKNLCMAGGVALNCVGNGVLLREGPFENIWIQPAAGDAGGALGAALFTWYQLLDKPRTTKPRDLQKGSLLGPRFSDEHIRAFLDGRKIPYHRFDDDESLCAFVADLLASEKVAGWVQGRMEFGPRALGSRSIIGDPRSTNMQTVMNVKIKFRESFRPFAPSVLEERVDEFFLMRPREQSPYMLQVAPVQESIRINLNGEADGLFGIDKLKVKRSTLPAITHVDYSARVQTVDPDRHGRYYTLLKAFEKRTGCPVLINTSFNVRGEPIVCTPEDAYRCFMGTNMDVLVLERNVLLRTEQPGGNELRNEEYLAQFKLD